jgi:transcriptional regulator with XRE-family HTH domain
MSRGLTDGAHEIAGRIAGAVLAAIRSAVGRTQEALAEEMQVGLSTVQAWESGRRPLVKASFQDLQKLTRRLVLDGAPRHLMFLFDQALLADSIYADIAEAEPAMHPLALLVPDRTLTELLAWPFTGTAPRQLAPVKAKLHIPAGVRDDVAAGLRAAADRSLCDECGAMLHRQVKFLVADHAPSADWLRTQVAAEVRAQPDLRRWSPQWPVVRSQAVAAAHSGDCDPLRMFIDRGLADGNEIQANLNYWAYWVGEHTVVWTADADMLQSSGWSGERLLASLIDGVVHAPYRELCIYTLWALLARRSYLLRRDAAGARTIAAVEVALNTNTMQLDGAARRRLEQVRYLAESAA